MPVSGALLPQHGVIFPALQAMRRSEQTTRWSRVAVLRSAWQTAATLRLGQKQIKELPGRQALCYERHRTITVTVLLLQRSALQNGLSKVYHSAAN